MISDDNAIQNLMQIYNVVNKCRNMGTTPARYSTWSINVSPCKCDCALCVLIFIRVTDAGDNIVVG